MFYWPCWYFYICSFKQKMLFTLLRLSVLVLKLNFIYYPRQICPGPQWEICIFVRMENIFFVSCSWVIYSPRCVAGIIQKHTTIWPVNLNSNTHTCSPTCWKVFLLFCFIWGVFFVLFFWFRFVKGLWITASTRRLDLMLWFINFHISSATRKQRGLAILWHCVFWLKWAVTERHLVTINFLYRSACLASAQLCYALERGCSSMLMWTRPACRLHYLIMADLIFKFSSSKTAEICISAVFLLCVKSEAGAV